MIHVEIITPCAVEITQYALKRAEAPSPGRRPGWLWMPTCRPERAKALKNPAINNSFALTGRLVACYYTQGDALGCELLGFQPVSTVHFGYFLLSPVLEIGPWVNPINDRLMFRLTMINVKNKSPFMFRFSKIQVKINHRFNRWMSATRMSW